MKPPYIMVNCNGERYRYSITSLRASSHKYGLCEVCGEHASEVFYMSEEHEYRPGHWTGHKCFDRWGHEQCLRSKIRSDECTHG